MADTPVFSDGETAIWNFRAEDCGQWRNRQLFEYWREKAAGRRFPARRDLDPLDMVYVLPFLSLVDVLRNPLRFRGRLIGTSIVEKSGFDLTGKWLDELPIPEYRELLLRRVHSIVEASAPLLVRNKQFFGGQWYNYEVIWLPLADDGEEITMLMSCQIFLRLGDG